MPEAIDWSVTFGSVLLPPPGTVARNQISQYGAPAVTPVQPYTGPKDPPSRTSAAKWCAARAYFYPKNAATELRRGHAYLAAGLNFLNVRAPGCREFNVLTANI